MASPITSPITTFNWELEAAYDPLGPYGLEFGGFDLAGGPVLRPRLNGALLTNGDGTVWLVVNGQARGYSSWELLLKVHDSYPNTQSLKPIELSWLQRRVFGDRPPPPYPHIKGFFTPIVSTDFIEVGEDWSQSLRLVWAVGCPQAIHNYEGGRHLIYVMPSEVVRDAHKLAFRPEDRISVEEFQSYEAITLNGPEQ